MRKIPVCFVNAALFTVLAIFCFPQPILADVSSEIPEDFQIVPVQTLPAQALPAETLPAEMAPDQTAPVETVQPVSTETASTQTAPVETVFAQSVPAETASTETAPAETVSAQTEPVETAPAETVVTEVVTYVTEVTTNITDDTDVDVSVKQESTVEQSAASSGTSVGGSRENVLVENRSKRCADITGDFGAASAGIISTNQAPGTLNNQSTAINVAFTAEISSSLLEATSALQNESSDNEIFSTDIDIETNIHAGAFSGTTGIIAVNQSAGSLNTQSVLINVCVGATPTVSLSDADLGMQISNNQVTDVGVTRNDKISTYALEGVSGIVAINQSSGASNHQATAISVSVQEINLF
ncbi:MAG: hypothetical protein V1736_09545 [Pseudomonadota bacterium]